MPSFNGVSFYSGFEAAHIFPLAYEGHWTANNYGRWMTHTPERGGTINSVQNGLFLNAAVHQLFDSYNVSVNPDVRIHTLYKFTANNYLRITIRSYASSLTRRALLASILIEDYSTTLNDPLISSSVGTLGRLSWPI